MIVQSTAKYVRVSPSKARPLARRLKGLPLQEALWLTRFSRQKAAALIGKALQAAMADVAHNHKAAADYMIVAEVAVEQGPMIKRYWPRSRGMVRPVRRPTSHIRVVLADNLVELAAEQERKKTAKKN